MRKSTIPNYLLIIALLIPAISLAGNPFSLSGSEPAIKCTVSCKATNGNTLKCSAYGTNASCMAPMSRNAVVCMDKDKKMVCDCVGNPDPGCFYQKPPK